MSEGLAGSKSPFLRHGAEQPVHWLPWGEAAFARARKENRPILLDIGAVWCHWCHVMDHESYEDEETARLINELYVPVKVDRDERPDVDTRYQRAVQAISGQGGWPLTAFLTPDGEVFYGGTYFPPDDRYGRPSFRRVLVEVARVWQAERGKALDAVREVRERVTAYAAAEAQPGKLSPALFESVVEALAESFDFRHGGFGRAPKFPNAGGVELVLDWHLERGEEWAGRIVTETLAAMARGGIYDQVGGGFHRYATDARWRIPHFEKMASDNGVLLSAYARACAWLEAERESGEPLPPLAGLLRRTAEGIVAWNRDVAPELVRAGGFPASQDADVGPNDDGGYWTWSVDEVREVMGEDDRLVLTALLALGLDDEGSAMHGQPERHVPYLALDAAGLAPRLRTDEPTAVRLLEEVRGRLLHARRERPRPYVDESLYVNWVALACSGHLAAARHLGLDDAGASALRALDRIWREAFDPERGLAHRAGDPPGSGFLEDYANLGQALLDAFEWTQEPMFLERTEQVLALALARFRDPGGGSGLVDVAGGGGSVVPGAPDPPAAEVHRPVVDAPDPAGNAVAARALLRLAALTGSDEWRRAGEQILEAFAGAAPRFGTSIATYASAVGWAVMPITTVVVVGTPGVPASEDPLWRVALAGYRPRTVIRRFESGRVDPAILPAELAAMVTGVAPRAYVCAGRTCAAPVAEADALRTVLRTLRG